MRKDFERSATLAKAAIFTGSFFAFLIEPMAGRVLLPHFGSSTSSWVTCLCAFQVFLVAGYAYGAAVSRWRRLVWLHVPLVVAAAAYTAFLSPHFAGTFAGRGVLGVCLTLTATILPAFLLLGANATVVQSVSGGAYRLYALSNAGSLAGLMAYALVVEPFVGIHTQWLLVAAGMTAYAAMLAVLCAKMKDAQERVPPEVDAATTSRLTWRNAALWLVLPFVGCGTLTAATTHLTMDIAGLPLVWAILLALYLLSWIVAFSPVYERHAILFAVAGSAAVLLAAVASVMSGEVPLARFVWNAVGVAVLLSVGLAAIHGMIYASRPSSNRLGVYYLSISVGGALGGVVVAVVAPRCFDSIAEYPIMLLAVALCLAEWTARWIEAKFPRMNRWLGYCGLGAVAAVLAWGRMTDVHSADGRLVHRSRGFYGLMSVREREIKASNGDKAKVNTLFNGRISHGFQVMHLALKGKPTMYYSLNGGGIAITNHEKWNSGKPMSVGMIGLGVGTLAAYGRHGDEYRFYEISPEDIAIATNTAYFSFIADSKANVEIVEGDARLELAKDVRQGMKFDVLVVDAYCGDAVPMHLITKDAFEMYKSAINDGGIIALHLSNWHMDLWPVVKAAARELGLRTFGTSSGAVLGEFAAATDWAFLSAEAYSPRVPTCCRTVDWNRVEDVEMPTDDKGSLLPFLRFNYMVPTVR